MKSSDLRLKKGNLEIRLKNGTYLRVIAEHDYSTEFKIIGKNKEDLFSITPLFASGLSQKITIEKVLKFFIDELSEGSEENKT